MKYCVRYNPRIKIDYDSVDELIIDYSKTNRNFLDFLNDYNDKTIIINITDTDQLYINDAKLIKEFNNYHKKIKVRIPLTVLNTEFFEKILELKIPFFFEDYAHSWDSLYNLLYYSPTDIYITQELGFELDKISKVLHEKNINIRVFPNVAQAGSKHIDPLKTFFIRPEDTEVYEPFVDVYEFFGNEDKVSNYLKIYQKDKKWFGQLREIIIGYNSNLDSRYIIPVFAKSRIHCGRKCLKGSKCRICERIEETSETLKNNNLLVKIKI